MSDPTETTVTFTGIPSGDHESFCWDVSAEEYRRLTGEAPPPGFAGKPFFHDGMFRLYESDLPEVYPAGDKPLRVTVTVRQEGKRRVCTLTTEEVE